MRKLSRHLPAVLALGAALYASAGIVPAALGAEEFKPQVGQRGKDVIWVPTPEELVERMLQMAKVGPSDFVIDLGSGDGRIAIAAGKKFGARAQGIEYNPDMVALSTRAAAAAGVSDRVKFVHGDIFQADFSNATVITMYLLPNLNMRLRPKLLEMKPGTRIVTNSFDMEDWQADETGSVDGRTAYLWIVPAKVAGEWELRIESGNGASAPQRLGLTQQFQMVNGSVRSGDHVTPLQGGRLHGADIQFVLAGERGAKREFSGVVDGATIEGTVKSGNARALKWSAKRVAAAK